MTLFLAIAGSTALLAAVYVVALNWLAVINWLRSRRTDSPRRSSLVPVLAQVMALASSLALSQSQIVEFPLWLFWAVALADPALLQLLYLPVFLLTKNRKPQT